MKQSEMFYPDNIGITVKKPRTAAKQRR